MRKECEPYYTTEEFAGDDVSDSGVVESVPHFWHQVTGTAGKLVAKGHGIIVKLYDRSDTEHELKPEEVESVVPDEEVEGGYSIVKRNGVKVAVIGAVILGAGAGIVVYKKSIESKK